LASPGGAEGAHGIGADTHDSEAPGHTLSRVADGGAFRKDDVVAAPSVTS